MKYIVTGDDYTSELFKFLDKDIKVINQNKIKENNIVFDTEDLCYVPSESALEYVINNHKNEEFKENIKQLKDKIKFRDLMKNFYPNFFYKRLKIDELDNLILDKNKKYVIKPVRGFFGTAINIFSGSKSLLEIKKNIKEDLSVKSNYFSDFTLSTEDFIIEEFISGDEFAVDMFFDSNGTPVILNIYHHPEPENFNYFHVLYYTGDEIFSKYLKKIENFFVKMNTIFKAENFPVHAEFKINDNEIIPIEMNPLRFGGFGLADLTYHAFNINPFNQFFYNKKVEWEKIWDLRKGYFYAWCLAYNGDKIDVNTNKPDIEKFKKYIKGELLHFVEMDYKNNPVFGIAYQKSKNFSDFSSLLKVEFNEFFL